MKSRNKNEEESVLRINRALCLNLVKPLADLMLSAQTCWRIHGVEVVSQTMRTAGKCSHWWPELDHCLLDIERVATQGVSIDQHEKLWVLGCWQEGHRGGISHEQEVRTGKCRHIMLGGGGGQPVLKHIFWVMFLAQNPFNDIRYYSFSTPDNSLSTSSKCWLVFCYMWCCSKKKKKKKVFTVSQRLTLIRGPTENCQWWEKKNRESMFILSQSYINLFIVYASDFDASSVRKMWDLVWEAKKQCRKE